MNKIFKLYWKIALYISPVICVIFFITKTNNSISSCQKSFETEKNFSYSGLVSKKYIDSTNHLNKTIKLTKNKGKDIVIFNYDKSGAYDYIQSGDIISKKSDNYDLIINRNGRVVVFEINYECKDK
ncbi:hypothetical protein [uncultured Algibacter sp.]|uniref:hypothetical protein n=1 Tax=uncultured Algibacter sp. TaxID=298659 RepID=UPI00261D42CD|nr:hypothetical protein [uncultured Algibacter sp.]